MICKFGTEPAEARIFSSSLNLYLYFSSTFNSSFPPLLVPPSILSCVLMKRPTIEFIKALCLIQSSHAFCTPLPKQAQSRLFSHRTDNGSNEKAATDDFNRRSFLKSTVQTLAAIGTQTDIASARGLARFPCKEPLLNTYHFMRAGKSLLEEENVWSTNPLFLTNREAALSELGDLQVRDACKYLISQGINPTVVRYSLAAASVDSANIVGEELRVSCCCFGTYRLYMWV